MSDLGHSWIDVLKMEYNVNGAPWNFIEYSYVNVDSTGRLAQPETPLQ